MDMSQTTKSVKTATVLHDPAKRKSKSDRPANVYKEHITNDIDGELNWWIWYNTEQGNEVGRKRLETINDLTGERTEQGFEYSIEYNDENKKKVLKQKFGSTKFYIKDGVDTKSLEVNQTPEANW